MNIPDEFKYDTLSELLEKRTKIKARPFPQGYSGEEHIMMMAVEEHCANTYMEALEALKEAVRIGENAQIGEFFDADFRSKITKLENVKEE